MRDAEFIIRIDKIIEQKHRNGYYNSRNTSLYAKILAEPFPRQRKKRNVNHQKQQRTVIKAAVLRFAYAEKFFYYRNDAADSSGSKVTRRYEIMKRHRIEKRGQEDINRAS